MDKKKIIIILLLCTIILSSCTNPTQTNQPIIPNKTNITIQNIQEPLSLHENNITIYFLNIKGNSILITTPKNNSVLINAGEEGIDLIKKINKIGLEKIDYLIITTSNKKYSGGIPYIILKYKPKVYTSGLLPLDQYTNINISLVSKDEFITLDDGSIILYLAVPYDNGRGFSTNTGENTIVVELWFGSKKFLFMSDCEGSCEKTLNNDLSENVEILFLSESCKANSPDFLIKRNPKKIVYKEICDKDLIEVFSLESLKIDNDYVFSFEG
ncbi:MAG: hypothetical protein QXU20_03775 [Candidatus Woesearchaeota archaeon]